MNRWTILLFGILSYLVFLGTIAYGIGFFGNLFVARTIDGVATVPLGRALIVNIGLIALFAVQHSGMARPRFKQWMWNYVDPAAVRSVYVLMSCMVLIALMVLWQPMGGVVWSVQSLIARRFITALYFLGWALMIRATFLLDHYEMFGLRQVWCHFHGGRRCNEPSFGTPGAYRYMRHPIYAGWLIVMWASPVMTTAHLVLAVGLTIYVLLGIQLEERDLERRLPYYEQYRRKVPMLLPSWRRRLVEEASAAETRP